MIGSTSSLFSAFGRSSSTSSVQTSSAGDTASRQGDPLSQLFSTVGSASGSTTATSDLQSFVESLSSGMLGSLLSVQERGSSTTATSSATTDDATTLFGTTSLGAAWGGGPSATAMSAIDTDGDGAMSESELSTFLDTNGTSPSTDQSAAIFASMDGNGDGSVSTGELGDWMRANAAPPSARAALETGGVSLSDGTSSAGEASSSTFTAADTNQDGTVSQSEFEAYFQGTATSDGDGSTRSAATIAQLIQSSYQRLASGAAFGSVPSTSSIDSAA